MFEELVLFLRQQQSFFIEAEAKSNRMQRFIDEYNTTYNENINIESDGVVLFPEDTNKWGLELRLYVNSMPPEELGFVRNQVYRTEYTFRLNSNNVVYRLFDIGFRIGLNGDNHE